MWNFISKVLLIVTIICAFCIYVSEYSNWSAGAGMFAGEVLMILIYEIFGPYLGRLLGKLDEVEDLE
jgi:hypothetical protein